MKRTLSVIMSAIILASSFVSCSQPIPRYSEKITATSSNSREYAVWLDNRLGEKLTDRLTVGTAEESNVNMDSFEDDGYIIKHDGDEILLIGKTEAGLDLALRKYAKFVERGEIVPDTVYHEGYRVEKLSITGHDISEYVIELSADANENVKFASRELSRLVNIACGTEIPISEGITDRACAFEFRYSDREDFFTEGFAYHIEGSRVVFEIAPERGAKNAVWYFLEKELNWECLTYGESILQESEVIDIPATASVDRAPAFDYMQGSTKVNPDDVVNGLNGFHMDRGITQTLAENSGQTKSAFWRYGQYRHANHGMEKNMWGGVVYSHWRQVCYTDEGIFDNILIDVRDYLASCGENDVSCLVDISQGDNSEYCKCDGCMKVFKEEKSNAGAVVRFANEMASQVNEDYPDVVFLIFAYHGSNQPPKTAPSDHVFVTYCLDGNCSAHPLDGEECFGVSFEGFVDTKGYNNKDYAQWLIEWCKLSPNIYVWYYQLPGGFNTPSYYTNIYKDFMFMKDAGIAGLYANCHTENLDLQRVYNKLWYELYWEHDMTEEEYKATWQRFLKQEYGDNWQAIDDYALLMERAQRNGKYCWNCWGVDAKGDVYFNLDILGSYLERFIDLFNEALSGCNTRTQEIFTCRLAVCAYFRCIYARTVSAYERGDEAEKAYLAEKYAEMVELLKKGDMNIKDYKGYADNYTDAVNKLWKIK